MARKAAMHTAAERARIRRQQDEEERERERERARKKAEELKENMKVEKSTTQELLATQVRFC
jgi:serine/arginine repetitive matrix protein 2